MREYNDLLLMFRFTALGAPDAHRRNYSPPEPTLYMPKAVRRGASFWSSLVVMLSRTA